MVLATIGEIGAIIGNLEAEHLASGTVSNHVKGIKALFRINKIDISFPHRLPRRAIYHDHARTPEELTKLIDDLIYGRIRLA